MEANLECAVEERTRKPRVLVVSPDLVVRKALMLSLMERDYDVIEATDIREATRLNRYLPADMLIAEYGSEDYIPGIRSFEFQHRRFKIVSWANQVRLGAEMSELAANLIGRLNPEVLTSSC